MNPDALTLLEELDARQSEVLDQLDELNARIEKLLQECSSDRAGCEANRGEPVGEPFRKAA